MQKEVVMERLVVTKRRLALALVLVALCAALGAAAATATPTKSSAVATHEGTPGHGQLWKQFVASLKGRYSGKTLHVISINDPFVPAFQTIGRSFKSLTGANVVVDSFPYDAVYQKELLACKQHSKTYDVIVFDVPWTQAFVPCTDHLNSRLAKEKPALIEYNDFFPVMRQAVDWRGQTIGLPFAPYFVLQHYNTKYYSALGLKPAKTLTQMIANAKAATKSSKFRSVYGIAMNNQAGSAVGQAFFEYIYNFPGGKPFASMFPGSKNPYADMTPMFASKQGLAVINLFKQLLPYQPPGALNIAWGDRQGYFNTGKIAAVNQWDVTTPSASDPKTSTVVGSYATAPFPTNGKLVTQVGGWSMGINKYGTQKDLTWDFMKWFTSPETSVQFALAGGFPPRTSSLSNKALASKYPWYKTLKQVIPTAFADCRPRITESFDIINTLGTYISKALTGSMTPKAAMLAADRQIGTMLKKRGYKVRSLSS
jgi:multiple sugar transport system substrate-binding protein